MKDESARFVRLIGIALPLFLAVFAGCSKAGRDQATGSVPVQGLATPDRLTQEDVDLYMGLMRAAAARVNNLLPADKAALGRMTRIQDDVEAGRIPTPMEGDPEAEIIERGMRVQQSLDLVIAEERGVDIEHYAAVRDLIENLINPSGIVADEVDDGSGKPLTPSQAQTRLANKKLLAPYAPEIEQLYQVVRRSLAEKAAK